MTGLDELRVSWAALAAGPRSDGDHVATLALEERVEDKAILVGLDLDGDRHLLVPALQHAVREDTGSGAVRIRELELGSDAPVRYCDVVSHSRELADVFDDLILAMLREISEGRADAPGVCAEVLERWRELLRPPPREPLNARQAAGLIAELQMAVDIVRRDPGRRIDVWTGPTGARHDFRRGPLAVEVKASLSQGEAVAGIHGFEQLAEPENGSLHLAWFRLERVPQGALTVAGMVENLRRLLGASESLYRRLIEAGWRPETAMEPLEFEIRERRIFDVGPEFPRFVPSMLRDGSPPAGVRNVRYDVVLDPHPILSDPAVDALLDEIATSEGS